MSTTVQTFNRVGAIRARIAKRLQRSGVFVSEDTLYAAAARAEYARRYGPLSAAIDNAVTWALGGPAAPLPPKGAA